MSFIRLHINPALRTVFAVGNGVPGGNVLIDSHELLEWRNGQPPNNRRVFLVRFFHWSGINRNPVWPFANGAVTQNHQCVDADGVRWLRVADAMLNPAFDPNLDLEFLEYKVYVEAESSTITCLQDAHIEPLDPMIIIRNKSVAASNSVMLGVTCAVLGAVAGAAITWALT